MMDVTAILARYVVSASADSVPTNVRREAVRSFLNWTGCAVGGSQHPSVDIALGAVSPFAGKDQAAILGRRERLDALNAALINGIASHVFDFDDTHLRTIIHPAGPVASAILSLAQLQPTSGRDLLHAFILGVEVECRIGNAVYPAHYDIGWHITGTAGVFGAAAAAGRLLGLNEQQMIWALGIAGTQSSGFREMFGTMCKSFHPGRAAQNGLFSALLAQRDFTSSNRVLEAPRGFAHVMSTERNFDEITKGLGDGFEIGLNTYKPFACGIVIHPIIDGCVQLRNEYGLKAGEIESIELEVDPLVLELTGKKTPQVGLEGKFSVYHSAAVAIIEGRAGEAEYSDASVCDPQVIALRDRVSAVASQGVAEDECHVTIKLRDGRVLKRHVEHAIGSLARPMTDDDLNAKFGGLAEPVLGARAAARLRDLCWDIESLDDTAVIAKAATPAA
ncbi:MULTISPECIES: MmgE/PrpD family protein [unclassified Mesorhizobium]|uniref:MmgE/PrpD family protein n=1 Tax=unclassified Mesorhizobium TaxID=325217 RepID=UPI0011279069|nr:MULTISPECIES: MmgE/PrpD family protein [unclassified Mesorhizobium]MBZ9894446.1 MmgE/PrpD family protein [Mesorhizobium sp. BR1-1-6]TPM57602.1 MmgE/PrpD family protein [Mesorhizobium sp. B2-2-4]TPM65595.1 MmgE/PrpD family protein [Mesorhizobium sp. B2-2-1]TPN38495.1 MmgE/PrpD family protein [Mesorhizobium sp. B1-1-6]TPN71921.1 MmgE/PrpD family protein [Mesorhizobium sp. B1-1-3]